MMSSLLSFIPARAAVLLPIVSLGLVPLAACSSGEGTGGGTTSTTTSSSTGTGGAGGATPEARVIVRDHAGQPAVGIDVLVHDPAGATTQQTKTDKTGAAVVDLVEGGGITALWKAAKDFGGPEYQAVSVVGLERGAEVRLVADAQAKVAAPTKMDLSFTGVAPLQSSEWDIVVSCRQDTMFGETTLAYEGCSTAGTYDLVAFLYPRDKRIVFPAQTMQPGMSVPFELDPAKAEAAPEVAVDVEALPPGTLSLQGRLWANRPEGGRTQLLIQQIVTEPQGPHLKIPRLFVSAGGSFDLELAANSATGSFHAHLPYADKDLPTSPITWKIPALTPIEKVGPILGDVRRPEVPWSLVVGGTPSDAVRFQLSYPAPVPIPGMGSQPAARWTLYVASTPVGTVTFPEIPSSLEGFAPADPSLQVLAQHIDIDGKDSVIAVVNADFDRTASTWISTSFTSPVAP
jgi:hypothetical protein